MWNSPCATRILLIPVIVVAFAVLKIGTVPMMVMLLLLMGSLLYGVRTFYVRKRRLS